MPISLPTGLPAASALAAEGVSVVSGATLRSGGARPLRICLVNLMPRKTATETQICRLLGATAIPVEVTLCVPDSYQSRSTPESHIDAFYWRWSQIRGETFDGLVMTGAPIETLPFEAVDYWMDLCAMLEWARARVAAGFYICWAAQAALYHFRGVPKHERAAKLSGVYRQRVTRADSILFRGFGDEFPVPVSRYTEVRASELPPSVSVLAQSAETGLCLVEDRANRATCMFNHLEYDTETLRDEFHRDRLAGKQSALPAGYFPDNDPTRPVANVWRPWAHLLFGNWLAEVAYLAWARDGGDRHRTERTLSL
ncbi:MAG TPA: homoserine O-succinyltransferase [Dongiaceae bacterium]|nr:homoserine O-succinyltransferase [Dongiaceae bacterium]